MTLMQCFNSLRAPDFDKMPSHPTTVIVHHKDAKASKTRKESSLKDTTFANLGVLCAFALHKRLYGENGYQPYTKGWVGARSTG